MTESTKDSKSPKNLKCDRCHRLRRLLFSKALDMREVFVCYDCVQFIDNERNQR